MLNSSASGGISVPSRTICFQPMLRPPRSRRQLTWAFAMAGIVITACVGGAVAKPPGQSPSQLPAGAIAAVPVGPYTSDNSVTAFDSLWLGEGTGKLYRIDLKTN